MQTSESTLAIVQRILAAEIDSKPEDLEPDRKLDELGLDSLAVIEAMFRLESELKIQMPQEQVPLSTVRDVAELAERLLAARNGMRVPEPELT